jgi:hypothetical protein
MWRLKMQFFVVPTSQNVALKDAVLRGSDKPKGNQTQSEQNDQL